MSATAARCHSPGDLAAALALLAERGPNLTVLAGGTDLMVYLELGTVAPTEVLDIWCLDALRGVHEDDDHLLIGALTTYRALIEHPLIQRYLPTLIDSAKTVGAAQIQNRGTIGGNLANASPAADTPPVLLAADAEVILASQRGDRTVALGDFFRGYKDIDRRPDELITAIRCRKRDDRARDLFVKVGTRRAQAISKVVLGARARYADDGSIGEVRLAFGSVAPITCRLPNTEALMLGKYPGPELAEQVRASAADEVTPIDDIRSREIYRREVTGNLAARFVRFLQSTP